jgi:presenilin-like A22 family membrane protease
VTLRLLLFGAPLLLAALLIIWAIANLVARDLEDDPCGERKRIAWATARPRNVVLSVAGLVIFATAGLRLLGGVQAGASAGRSGQGIALAAVAFLALISAMAIARCFKGRVAVAVFVMCASPCLVWALWPNWLTGNVLATILCIGITAGWVQMTINFRFTVLVNGAVFLYDILHVYITGWMHGMVAPESVTQLPLLLLVPQNLSLDAAPMNMVGLGDIALPGFMIVVAAVLAYRRRAMSLLYAGLAGYAVGLSLTGLLVMVFQQMQPAMILLFPCTLIPILWAARRAGLLGELLSLQYPPAKPAHCDH